MGGRPTGKLDIGALLDEAARANEALRSAAPRTDKAADRQPRQSRMSPPRRILPASSYAAIPNA